MTAAERKEEAERIAAERLAKWERRLAKSRTGNRMVIPCLYELLAAYADLAATDRIHRPYPRG